MTPQEDKLSFLRSSTWWSNSFILSKKLLPKFFLPAILFALSNFTSIYSDSLLSSGFELGDISQAALGKMFVTMMTLTIVGSIGLILGLIGLSLWMFELTALARLSLLMPLERSVDPQFDLLAAYSECSKEIKKQGKHFSATWMIGFLFLLGPIFPLSALIAGCVLANSSITAFGQHIVVIPAAWIAPVNIAIAFLSAITINYSLTLTVLSASVQIKPRQAALLAGELIAKQFVALLVIDAILFTLDILLSAPFVLMPAIPAISSITHNLLVQAALQLWFALSSAITWPISVLIFTCWLKDIASPSEPIKAHEA